MTTVDRTLCREDLFSYHLAGVFAVNHAERRTDVPPDVDGAHIINEPNRAFAPGDKVGAVRIVHPSQLNPPPLGVLLTDTLQCLFAYKIHMTSSFVLGTTYITLKGEKVKENNDNILLKIHFRAHLKR